MKNLSRLIIKGGVLSPAELRLICQTAKEQRLEVISFGSRQDIIFPEKIKAKNLNSIQQFKVVHGGKKSEQNIMSSYLTADIFTRTSWLTGDKYLYILESLDKDYFLKINITDPKQRLVPLFTGHLNFIASEDEDYWYLYVRLPNWQHSELYPVLIYSWDIAKLIDAIDNLLKEEPYSADMIFELVSDALQTNNRTIDKPLLIPFHPFPYYEGFNKMGTDKYWLGLYWRENNYYLDFLIALCDLCSECKIGKISITPWKSIIVKDIPISTKLLWEKFLGKHGINVRHSLLELNWHLPVNNKDALALKNHLVKNFDTNDISTYGLTFGITNYAKKSNYFTAIVIEKNKTPAKFKDFKIRDTYNLHYAKNFDPNTRSYIMHVQEVDKTALPDLLMELSRLYFEQLGTENEDTLSQLYKVEDEIIDVDVYQCKDCLSIYEPILGDQLQHIAPNTPFENLNYNYKCPLCEADKSCFEKKTVVRKKVIP